MKQLKDRDVREELIDQLVCADAIVRNATPEALRDVPIGLRNAIQAFLRTHTHLRNICAKHRTTAPLSALNA